MRPPVRTLLALALPLCALAACNGDGKDVDSLDEAPPLTDPNLPPVVSDVVIEPGTGVITSSALTCSGTANDPENVTPSLRYAWTVGNQALGSGPEITLTPDRIEPGDVIACTITATDDYEASGLGTGTVIVENQLPIVEALGIVPAMDVTVDSVLRCTTTARDPDARVPTIAFAWSVDGAALGEGDTLDLSTTDVHTGDNVVCTVTVTDAHGGVTTADTAVTVVLDRDGPVYTLNDADIIFTTDQVLQRTGWSLASGGDIDGDGKPEVVISGPKWTDFGEDPPIPNVGRTYVFRGADLRSGTDKTTADAAFYIQGEAADNWLGYAVSSAGDVDGDGRDDLLVSAVGNDDIGMRSGKVYLFLADSIGSGAIDATDADYTFIGEAFFDQAGVSIAGGGDFDGDGLGDLLISANYADGPLGDDQGKVYVIPGASLGRDRTIDLNEVDTVLYGEQIRDEAGYDVAFAGDVDGDGLDDVLVGAPYSDQAGEIAGKVHLVSGVDLIGVGEVNVVDVQRYAFIGENARDFVGAVVSTAGDVDGDGLADIFIGAPGNNTTRVFEGRAYLVLAASLGETEEIPLSNADHIFIGEIDQDFAGYSVDGIGDYDGDGHDDLLIGAPGQDIGGLFGGQAYLISGGTLLGAERDRYLSASDYFFQGRNPRDAAGWAVAGAGDVNQDGLADFLVGAPFESTAESGVAYLVYGP